MPFQNDLTKNLGIAYPLLGGAMYPCSNPELVAAVSEAGGMGIIQPLSLTYVYGYEFRKGLEKIQSLTSKPVGMNIIVEKSSKVYSDRMAKFVDQALEGGVRFFVTALGNPRWVVDKVKAVGGTVFHDVTERKWAEKALEAKVDGLICVNRFAGGHAGTLSPEELYNQLKDLGVPLICAGGISEPKDFPKMLKLGYQGIQMGTRFVASSECAAGEDYKKAIVAASAKDIVLTERLTGVPVAVINTPMIQELGTKAGFLARQLLKHRKTKHWVRLWYSLKSLHSLRKSMHKPMDYKDYYQAGKSVEGINGIEAAGEIVRQFAKALT